MATPSIVVPPPLAPLPKVAEPVIQPPVMEYPTVLPKFQKISLPPAPRVQISQPFVPVLKPHYHLNQKQMFFNMPTLKQRLAPLVNCVSYDARHYTFPAGYTLSPIRSSAPTSTYKSNRCLPCLAVIMSTTTQVKKEQSIRF